MINANHAKIEQNIIKNGFWNVHAISNFGIKPTTFIEDYRPTEKLNLWITQLDFGNYLQLPVSQKKKLIKSWCQKLPELEEVKYLWLPSNISQEIFDSICEMKNLEGLWIKWSGIKSIDNITNLKNLKHLHLGSSSQVQSIDALSEMKNLVTLETEQLNKITDFSVVGKLTQLEGLGLDGSMWTSQKIEDLNFISSLQQLKYLTLSNTKMTIKSFDPLLKLQNLERFNCSWNYPEKEFQKLKTMKNLKYGNIETSWKQIKEELNKQL